jgi:hypothetical protein
MGGRLRKTRATCKFLRDLETAQKSKCARREILNNIGYQTDQVSHFLHSQLIDAVNAHAHVLKDSLNLIRELESMSFSSEHNFLLTSADVAALYPSINIEDDACAAMVHGRALQHTSGFTAEIPQARLI